MAKVWLTGIPGSRAHQAATKIRRRKPLRVRKRSAGSAALTCRSWAHTAVPNACPFGSFRDYYHSLFKVLFIFPSRYLSTIGFLSLFSLRWYIPPVLNCTLKQFDSPIKILCSTSLPKNEPLFTGVSPSLPLYSKRFLIAHRITRLFGPLIRPHLYPVTLNRAFWILPALTPSKPIPLLNNRLDS